MLEEDGLLDLVLSVPANKTGPAFLDALYDRLRAKTHPANDFDDDISAAFLEYAGP